MDTQTKASPAALPPILVETYELLDLHWQAERGPEIAKAAEVGLHWLRKFHLRKFDNPGIVTVCTLHAWLSSPGAKRRRTGAAR